MQFIIRNVQKTVQFLLILPSIQTQIHFCHSLQRNGDRLECVFITRVGLIGHPQMYSHICTEPKYFELK
jgi:hypothetical protein